MNNIGWGLALVSLVSLGVLGCSAANMHASADEQASLDEQGETKPPQRLEEVFGDAQGGGGAQWGSGGPTPFGPGGPPPHGSGASSTLEARPDMARTQPPTPEEAEERRRIIERRKRLRFPLDVKRIAGEGRIEEALVMRQLRRRRPAFVNCYDRGIKRGEDAVGYVGLRFSVREDGRVSEAEIVENTSKSEVLGACLEKRLLGLRFPKPEGGGVTFSWGVRLHAPKSGGQPPSEERPSPATEGKEAAGKPSSEPTPIIQGGGGLPNNHPHPWKPELRPQGVLTPEEIERREFRKFWNTHFRITGPVTQIGGEGRIDPSLVLKGLRRQRASFRYCYERSHNDGKRVKGYVGLRFSVGERGRVSEVKIAKNTSRNTSLGVCLKQWLLRVRFPKPEGGALRFSAAFRMEKEMPKKKPKSGRPNKVIHKR